MVGEVKAAFAPIGLPATSVHSSPASWPPSKSQNIVLEMMVPPSFGSVIETDPGQVAVYWICTWAGSTQTPAVLLLLPSVKLLVASEVPPALYCHSPVRLSALPPLPMV